MSSRWEGIDEFVAVAESGQFTAAAERLGVSSSHISRQIARLEERLQTRLLYRSTRRVTLSEAGQTFLQHCQRLQDGREEALRAMGDLASEPKGLLRMTCAVAYGERFIVPLVTRFMALYPQLRVDVELSNHTLDLLHEGMDLAIRLGRLADSRLVATRLAPRRMYCAPRRPTWNVMAGRTACRNWRGTIAWWAVRTCGHCNRTAARSASGYKATGAATVARQCWTRRCKG